MCSLPITVMYGIDNTIATVEAIANAGIVDLSSNLGPPVTPNSRSTPHSLGVIDSRSQLTFEFVLLNSGTMPVTLTRVTTNNEALHCGDLYPGVLPAQPRLSWPWRTCAHNAVVTACADSSVQRFHGRPYTPCGAHYNPPPQRRRRRAPCLQVSLACQPARPRSIRYACREQAYRAGCVAGTDLTPCISAVEAGGTPFPDWDEADFAHLQKHTKATVRGQGRPQSRTTHTPVTDGTPDAGGISSDGLVLAAGCSVGVPVTWFGRGKVGRHSAQLLVWCRTHGEGKQAAEAEEDGDAPFAVTTSSRSLPRFRFAVQAVMQVCVGHATPGKCAACHCSPTFSWMSDQPPLQFQTPALDLGVVPLSRTAVKQVWFHNNGVVPVTWRAGLVRNRLHDTGGRGRTGLLDTDDLAAGEVSDSDSEDSDASEEDAHGDDRRSKALAVAVQDDGVCRVYPPQGELPPGETQVGVPYVCSLLAVAMQLRCSR